VANGVDLVIVLLLQRNNLVHANYSRERRVLAKLAHSDSLYTRSKCKTIARTLDAKTFA
jgi:hypothetical protein